MAKIDALPVELIAHTLLYLADLPTQDKVAISHVCRRWRDTALSSSRFWATINIYDVRNLGALSVLLERSGNAALHVRIKENLDRVVADPHDSDTSGDSDDSTASDVIRVDSAVNEQLDLLSSHLSRLHSLEIYFDAVATREQFVRSGLEFPVLETMIIDSASKNNHSAFFDWIAPSLRTLKLTMAKPLQGWTDLLQNSPLLENLSVTARFSASDIEVDALLASAFGLCRKLRKFALVAPFMSDDDLTVPADGWKPSNSLCSVDLQLGPSGDELVLEGLSTTFLPSITVTSCRLQSIEFPDDTVVPLLMRGIGRIVAIELEPEQNVTLRDENGNERRLMFEYDRFCSPAYFDNLWQYVCTHHGAAAAVATFAVTSENWESYSQMPSGVPPPADVQLRLTRDLWAKREGWNRQPPLFGQDGQGTCSDLRCNARKVYFDTECAMMGDVAPLKAALRRIKSPSTIELCLRIRSRHVERERWIGEGLRIVVELSASRDDEWTLCALCASASH